MLTSIDSNPCPLDRVTGTPGTPVRLTANHPNFDCPYVNLILLQAAAGNKGKCYLGNARLNKDTGEGLIYTFMVAGDTFVLSNFAINVYRMEGFRLDFDYPGDGIQVTVYVR